MTTTSPTRVLCDICSGQVWVFAFMIQVGQFHQDMLNGKLAHQSPK